MSKATTMVEVSEAIAELKVIRRELTRLQRDQSYLMAELHRQRLRANHILEVKRAQHDILDELYRMTKATREAALREVVESLVPRYDPDYPEDHGFSEKTAAIIREALRNTK